MTTERLQRWTTESERLIQEAGLAIAPASAELDADLMFMMVFAGRVEVHTPMMRREQAVRVVKMLRLGWEWSMFGSSRWHGKQGAVELVIDIYGDGVGGRQPLDVEALT